MLSMLTEWFNAPPRAPPVHGAVPAHMPNVQDVQDDVPDRATFSRLCARYSHLVPREQSVGAFVLWLQELHETGHWSLHDLYDDYLVVCELTGVEAIPEKWFTHG